MTIMQDQETTSLELFPYEENADPERKTHMVAPSDNPELCRLLGNGPNLTSQDIVDHARFMGLEVTALCGYTWVPVHNPEKFDICDPCLTEAHNRLENG